MTKPIAVLFDIDETLVHTGGSGARSWNTAFQQLYGVAADIGEHSSAGETDPQLASAGTLLAEAMINTREAAEALRRYLDVLDIDPARQEEIERHAAALEALGRKHRVPVTDLPEQSLRIETELTALDPRLCRVVELKFFGGLSIEETAEVLGVGHATVERDWKMARAWLRGKLE